MREACEIADASFWRLNPGSALCRRPPVTDEEHHEETAYGDATPSIGMDMMYVVM